MKVVTNALSDLWPQVIACAGCSSRLEVTLDDVRRSGWKISGYHFDGSAECEDRWTVRCPVCGHEAKNMFPDAMIPVDARREKLAAYKG